MQKFSQLAHHCWSKVVGNDNSIVELEDHMAAVAGGDKRVENSASIISGYLMTEHDKRASTETITYLSIEYSNEQLIAEAITDKTESTITVNEIETENPTNEALKWIATGYPTESC